MTQSRGITNHSICPKGWTLPSYSEGQTIVSNYTTFDQITSQPINYVMPGFIHANNNKITECDKQSDCSYNTNDFYRVNYLLNQGAGGNVSYVIHTLRYKNGNIQQPSISTQPSASAQQGVSVRCIAR